MARAIVSDDEFVALWESLRSPQKVANELGCSVRSVYSRRADLQHKLRITLESNPKNAAPIVIPDNRVRVEANIEGAVVVFSDAHFFPGFEQTSGYQALLNVIKEIKPTLIIANGDIMDGATMSSFSPMGWHKQPTMKEELDAVQAAMSGIQKVAKGAFLHRTIGNHDIRFDKRLAAAVPELRDVYDMSLRDHLPHWKESWSVFINSNTMVKHRYHSGVHSSWNNVLKSGVNMVCGHTHQLEIKPYGDYRGRRYGVSTGMLANPRSSAFVYTEDAPVNWCQGFAVLTFCREHLLPPELCEVIDDKAYFRGQIVN